MVAALAERAGDRGGGLDDLLREAGADSAEFPVALADHGPIVLTILARLGAPSPAVEGGDGRHG